MAAISRIFALDLGTQTVALGEFRAGADGSLVLTNYRSTELLADPAADATRQAQARIAISEMVSNMGYKGQPIHFAIASQSVFTRFVKLPSVGEEQVEQIVTFEAQQNVPYPINEVVWDYQLVETSDSNQVEVVIVAIKSDLLDEINEAVEHSTLRTTVVDVSPMALYNAFRYNYSELTGCSLIIDIGARTTNLIFVEPKKVFSRSIPTGGNTISAAIAKDFNEPFGAAEERKKRDGFVSLGGSYADPEDPDAARISKITRNTMTRLHAEITRSISFYRSQQNGGTPARVYLAGGSSSMPYMREFFQEKFQMPVEFFNPLRNVAVGGELNVEEISHRAHNLGGVVGLALRSAGSCPMELNLRPASVIRRQRTAKQRPAWVLAALCLLAGLTAWWLYFQHAADIADQVVEKLQPQVSELKGFDDRIKRVQSDIKGQEELAQPLLLAVRERDYWADVINDVNSRIPPEFIWIVTFEPKVEKADKDDRKSGPAGPAPKGPKSAEKAAAGPPTQIEMQGLYLDNDRGASVVDDFVTKLEQSELYTAKLKTRETPDETVWAHGYAIDLTLKNPIALGTSIASKARK